MTDGMSKTRKGNREIISVSLPVHVYNLLQTVCDHYNMNRSNAVTSAIVDYLKQFGIVVGDRPWRE